MLGGDSDHARWKQRYTGTSLIGERPPPQDRHRDLGIALQQGPGMRQFLMHEVPCECVHALERWNTHLPPCDLTVITEPRSPPSDFTVIDTPRYRSYSKLRTHTALRPHDMSMPRSIGPA